ncbi:MAG: glycosyltransferase [Patescibacteria group bacterium]
MRIIIATSLFPPEIEYVATYVRELAEHLKKDHQVQILAYAGNFEKIDGVKIFTINKKQPLFFRIFKYFIKLHKLAKQADIMYVQNSTATILPAILVKRLTKKPLILNFIEDEVWKRARHNNLTQKSWENFLEQPDIDRRIGQIFNLQKQALRQADKIIFSCQALAQAVAKSYSLPAEKTTVNYLPAEKIELPLDQSIKKNHVLVFGQDFNLDTDQWDKDWKVVLANKQSLSKAELLYLLNISELIVYNIRSENFDNFLVDCVLAGKKIVANETNYAKEIIGEQGVFVDFNNRQAVQERIEQLLDKKSKNQAEDDRFIWENHLRKLQDTFQASVKK